MLTPTGLEGQLVYSQASLRAVKLCLPSIQVAQLELLAHYHPTMDPMLVNGENVTCKHPLGHE